MLPSGVVRFGPHIPMFNKTIGLNGEAHILLIANQEENQVLVNDCTFPEFSHIVTPKYFNYVT